MLLESQMPTHIRCIAYLYSLIPPISSESLCKSRLFSSPQGGVWWLQKVSASSFIYFRFFAYISKKSLPALLYISVS